MLIGRSAMLRVYALASVVWLTHAGNDTDCNECDGRKIVQLQTDFNKLASDPKLNSHVAAVVERLKTFKIPVHPRTRIFYEMLKLSMREYAQRTADSLYVPDTYNVAADERKETRSRGDTLRDTNTTAAG